MKRILYFFIGWKGYILFGTILATCLIPYKDTFTLKQLYQETLPYPVFVLGNFDGFHYISIAKYGYGTFQHPFMPLYPIFIALLSNITKINQLYSAVFISNISFVLGLFVIVKLSAIDGYKRLTPYVLISIFLFPTSLFYGAAYNDSLFFFLASLCLLMARKQKYLFSGVCGMFAVLARINGLALFPFILGEFLLRDQTILSTWQISSIYEALIKSSKQVKESILILLYSSFIPLSFIGYLIYTQITFGDWNLVFTSMQVWNQDKIIFPIQVLYRYLKILLYFPVNQFEYWIAVGELAAFIVYVSLLIVSYKRIRLSYWLFFLFSILIPSLTGTFQGMPRYGLHIYPMFLTIALISHKVPKIMVIAIAIICILLLFLYTAYFTRGYFVA